MSEYKEQVQHLLKSLTGDGSERIQSVCNFLGYNLARNPVNPESPWLMFEHPHFDMSDQAVVAAIADDELNENTTIRELRQRFSKVQDLQHEISASYRVEICMFVGVQRIILFKALSDNRDDRLDLSLDSVSRVGVYGIYFIEKLSVTHIQIEEDDLGLGYEVQGLDRLFERELSSRFNYVVELYRKKIAEAIVSSDELREPLTHLVPKDAATLIEKKRLAEMIENDSFKVAIGCVVDTIVLRQLLRRFLEAYHGVEQFNSQRDLRTLGLGVGEGRLEDVLYHLVEVYFKDVDDAAWQKTVQKSQQPEQLTFSLFDEQEEQVTATISFKRSEEELIEFYHRMREQFELAYGGDLFAGSVSYVTNEIEDLLNIKYPQLLPKLWADTSTQYYNFRYEDLSPKFLQNQYEQSMSRSIQFKWNKENKPVVFYGEDLHEQKTKGAYYTDDQLVQYMVSQALGTTFNRLLNNLKEAVLEEDIGRSKEILLEILGIRIVDITCGGGSFLRGAFQYLAKSREAVLRTIQRSEVYEEIVQGFPTFSDDSLAQCEWEKHILLNMIYGIDIDYKALIIASQTLTLSALRNWRQGEGFAQLIGLTLIHQNALINPVPLKEREELFYPLKKQIAELISLRQQIRGGDWKMSSIAEESRRKLQGSFKANLRKLFGDYGEILQVEILELNIPEVFFDNEGNWTGKGFDVALGNPPWEIWKPNSEEFFEGYDSRYRQAKKHQKDKMEKALFKQYPHLKKTWELIQDKYSKASKFFLDTSYYEYQKWKVEGKFTGSDINLYKISLERFYQLLGEQGTASILVPGNIATDRGATGLRNLLLGETKLMELLSFENRKKIFASVDSRFKIAVVTFVKETPPVQHEFKTFFYRIDLEDIWKKEAKMTYNLELVKRSAPDTLSLMELRSEKEKKIIEKLYQFLPLRDERSKWKVWFTNELHMKNHSHLFDYEATSGIPVYKGEAVHQYKLMKDVMCYVKPADLQQVNKTSYRDFRIAFRKIARGTDKRTLISTLLPPNVLTADSLTILHPLESKYADQAISIEQQLILLSLMNSFVIDFIIRRKVTANVNNFYVYQLPIAEIDSSHEYYKELLHRAALLVQDSPECHKILCTLGVEQNKTVVNEDQRIFIQCQIDALIAQIYRLTREEFIYVLKTFESTNHREDVQRTAQLIIEQFDTLQEEGTLKCH